MSTLIFIQLESLFSFIKKNKYVQIKIVLTAGDNCKWWYRHTCAISTNLKRPNKEHRKISQIYVYINDWNKYNIIYSYTFIKKKENAKTLSMLCVRCMCVCVSFFLRKAFFSFFSFASSSVWCVETSRQFYLRFFPSAPFFPLFLCPLKSLNIPFFPLHIHAVCVHCASYISEPFFESFLSVFV